MKPAESNIQPHGEPTEAKNPSSLDVTDTEEIIAASQHDIRAACGHAATDGRDQLHPNKGDRDYSHPPDLDIMQPFAEIARCVMRDAAASKPSGTGAKAGASASGSAGHINAIEK